MDGGSRSEPSSLCLLGIGLATCAWRYDAKCGMRKACTKCKAAATRQILKQGQSSRPQFFFRASIRPCPLCRRGFHRLAVRIGTHNGTKDTTTMASTMAASQATPEGVSHQSPGFSDLSIPLGELGLRSMDEP